MTKDEVDELIGRAGVDLLRAAVYVSSVGYSDEFSDALLNAGLSVGTALREEVDRRG